MDKGLLQGFDQVKRFACAVALALCLGVAFAPVTAYAADIDSVRAAIQALSADPTDFAPADKAAVEQIWTDFQALSAEDQATLDAEKSHDDTGQSLGRVLEVALWAVWSYETDDTTTLASGTYTTSTVPAVTSASSKGKSDSGRVRNWWVESIEVSADGHATAYVYVTDGTPTAAKLTSYPSIWAGGETIPRDANNNYPIPVDLNGVTYFAGNSSSMATPIIYELTTSIDESGGPSGTIEFSVTNTASGLAVSQAYAEVGDGGAATLVVDMVGDGAGYLYVGTLGAALASGSTDSGWIAGVVQGDGSVRFSIPTSLAYSYLPISVVAAASSDIAADVHPYQFEIDYSAATLVFERYDNVIDSSTVVANGVNPEFNAASEGVLRVIGGPNDDVFKCVVTLNMDDGAHDYIEYNSLIEGQPAVAGTALSNGAFQLVFENSAGNTSFALDEALAISVRHTDSGAWLDRTLTIDLAAGTVTIGGSDNSIDVVKALIEALPRDPFEIRNDSSGAIATAAAAYDALPEDAQEQLDAETVPFSNLTYGRTLENAQWAVDAMTTQDASTTLPDGVYTTGIESSSNMGKSSSSRDKGFKVISITVRDGVATAILEHESTTDGIIHINGREYANLKPESTRDYRTYEVPLDLNATTHLVWKSQNASASATGVSVELENEIDESRTSPDSPLPSDNPDPTPSSDSQDIQELLDAIAKLIASQGKTANAANPNASTASNSAALAAAAAARNGTAGSDQYGTSGATTDGTGAPAAEKTTAGNTGGLTTTGLGTGADATSSRAAPWALGAALIAAAALGLLGFTMRFVRRERLD